MASKDWNFGKQKDTSPPWPNTAEGQPVPPVFLTHLRAADLEGEIVINLLTSADIPVVMQYPNDGTFGRVVLGFSGTGIDLYVPETLLEDAKAMMSGQFEEMDFEEHI